MRLHEYEFLHGNQEQQWVLTAALGVVRQSAKVLYGQPMEGADADLRILASSPLRHEVVHDRLFYHNLHVAQASQLLSFLFPQFFDQIHAHNEY